MSTWRVLVKGLVGALIGALVGALIGARVVGRVEGELSVGGGERRNPRRLISPMVGFGGRFLIELLIELLIQRFDLLFKRF